MKMHDMCGRNGLLLAFVLTFLGLLGICIGTWNSMDEVSLRPAYQLLPGEKSRTLPGLGKDVAYSQSFTIDRNGFCSLGLQLACYGRKNNFTVCVVLRDLDTSRVVASQKIPAETITDNAYHAIDFPRIKDSKGKRYSIELHGEDYASSADIITIWTRRSHVLPSAKVNGAERQGAMMMTFTYRDENSLHTEILHIEMLSLLGIFFLYALWVYIRQKMGETIAEGGWEKYLYPLLFLVGMAVLMARAVELIAIPDLYTEDATWSGWIMERGFWKTFLHARHDYFVSGNVLFLGLGLLINKMCFGFNMFFFPIILAFLQFALWTTAALLPVVLFKRNMGLFYRILMFAAFMMLSGSKDGRCSYEIFGKISNIGFMFCFIAFCILMHIYNNRRTIAPAQLILYFCCMQICYMTNPVTNVIVFLFFCMNVVLLIGAAMRLSCSGNSNWKNGTLSASLHCDASLHRIYDWRILAKDRFFWVTCILGVMLVATFIVGKLILPGKLAIQGTPLGGSTYGAVIEAVCRSFYPIFSPFYHCLTAVRGTLALLIVFGFIIAALILRRRDLLFWMLLPTAVSFMLISLCFRSDQVIASASGYVTTWKLRYAYGVTMFIYIVYFMAMESFFKRKSIVFKAMAWSMLLLILLSFYCMPKKIHSFFPENTRYMASFFDHKDVRERMVCVSVPVNEAGWHMRMPNQNFKATQEFLLKHGDGCRIPSLESLFFKANYYWKNCINRSRAAFYVRNTEENRKKFRKGCKVVLPPPYGERIIEGVREDRIFFDVYLSGSRLATDKVIDFEKCIVNAQK